MDLNEKLQPKSVSKDDKTVSNVVQSMEADRIKFIELVREKLSAKETECLTIKEENSNLKKKISELENNSNQLSSNILSKILATDDDSDMLTKAKALLFEKTNICKQQELQIEALKNQVIATKDVLDITKDMLNLRNIETDHLQDRFETLTARLKGEREKFQLTEKKLAISTKMQEELRKEYDLQQNIFKELRKGYEAKINALNKQITIMNE